MKRYLFLLIILFAVVASCKLNRVDPIVSTLRVPAIVQSADREIDMAVRLYDHYSNSDKSKEFYEVISKNRGEILNYYPSKQLLTTCPDPGSGWGRQFKEVDLVTLRRISDNKITFSMYPDSLTSVNSISEFTEVKTNGHPTL